MSKHYNEIRNILEAKKIAGLCGKGVSEEEIGFGERELGVRFPLSYRMFLKEYGWGYFGSLELIAGLGSDIPQEWWKGANLLQVVTDERNGPSRFPKEIIPICQNGAGDWYALDCSQSNRDEVPVVFVGHEQVAASGFGTEKCAESFADWVFNRLSERS